MIIMLMILAEKVDNRHDQIRYFRKEVKIIRKNKMKMLEVINTVTEMTNVLDLSLV